MLLNAVKDVMTALRDLINETKKTSGNPDNNSAEESTKATAKVVLKFLHFTVAWILYAEGQSLDQYHLDQYHFVSLCVKK